MGDGDHKEGLKAGGGMAGPAASWRLNVSDFQMPERPKEPPFVTRVFLRSHVRSADQMALVIVPG
ncbi:unnamed protein product [Miscanthus lutarioriparius]|uniref:Uncharacterized protein n=1 Tax=Miscanthus lutarioriparius TaxID=422564 RepID=A0A811NYG5_9POAL|nr:unnamed protein product [Miscanthus lutarioriparius]